MMKKLLFAFLFASIAVSLQAQTVVWKEDFDAASTLPAGWSQTSSATDGGWKVGSADVLKSQYFPIPSRAGNIAATNDDNCNCNKTNEVLRTGSINLSGQTKLTLLLDLYFFNATYGGATETLKLMASVDGGTTWADVTSFTGAGSWRSNVSVDLSAYAGQANVQLAFRYDDGGGWEYGAAIDNLSIVVPDNVIKASLSNARAGHYIDAIPGYLPIYGTGSYSHMITGSKASIRGTINNNGFPAITSYDVKITRNGQSVTKSYTNQNIGLGTTSNFVIDDLPVAADTNRVKVEIVNVNGVGDNDASDNVADLQVVGITPKAGRKVVVEEGTGTWCGWCPRGAVMMDYLHDQLPDNVIPIAVHNSSSDPMRVTIYDTGMSSNGMVGGYPSGAVDRTHRDIDPGEFEQFALVQLAKAPEIIVTHNVTWDAASRKANVTSALRFLKETNGADYRIAVVYTEDGVTGTATGYNQANYYSGGGQGQMGGFQDLANPVPAAQMVYNHVARAIIGGFTGKAGSVPVNNPAGSVMFFESTYTVPATQNVDNMHVITMVIDQATGNIVASEDTELPYTSTGANEITNDFIAASIFPNPIQDAATITLNTKENTDVMIRIVDAFGRVVSERNYANINGKQFLPFQAGNLANGMYTMVATANGQSVSKPFMIAR